METKSQTGKASNPQIASIVFRASTLTKIESLVRYIRYHANAGRKI